MNNIYHRVSIRKYKDCPVEKDKLLQILKAGMQAPNACNQQPWEFYVVTDKETIQKLSQITPYARCAAKAPVIIVPVYRTEGLPALPMVAIDMGMALENIWLGDRCTRPRRCLHRDISHSGTVSYTHLTLPTN